MLNIKKFVKSILWVSPFFLFVFGYYFAHSFFHKRGVETPNIIGKTIQEAIKEVSKRGLNIRLFREKINSDLEEGVVLEQIPQPYSIVKPTQHLFVTVSRHPIEIMAPQLLGKKYLSVIKEVKKMGIRPKVFWIESNYPKDICFAQSPVEGERLQRQVLLSYFSLGKNKLSVFPDLKNLFIVEVQEFFEKEKIDVDIVHDHPVDDDHECFLCKVVDQKPMAGAIVDLSKKLYVQLQVSEK